MRTVWKLLTVTLVLSVSSGCQGLLQPPGPVNYQQSTAVIHDPFPLGDIGPDDLASRPPGYLQPLPGPVRNRIAADTMPWLGIPGP